MSWLLHRFATVEQLHHGCAQALEEAIRSALFERGSACLALAGGSTPLPIYRLLSQAQLDWNAVHIVPTDERWVGPDDVACNLMQLKRCFPQRAQIGWIPLVPDPAPALAQAAWANQQLAALPRELDAVLLGMGLDAHTGSLFPGAAGLSDALALASPVDAFAITPVYLPPEAPYPRISLGAARLLRSRLQVLAITGSQKHAVLEQASVRDDPALPISRLLHAPGAQLQVYWSL